ncbi:amino acid adenylation domain-containing protein [Allocatelliglobosispora scoriae]|uniref:Amino acid adenylation domain-containing protein n=1 Tax=Allocatelliglobosispora scoriae TaxID=643052 RepID=A0A841BNZ4_9ACTN|nr:non-ribosomal peptide synthetase/MFS transporter [Allocatelliglobosispora scoriae]MBB5869385.1 amino acid adenylation domain-containing protein [Allocatelliglobosispora scoriae]
MTVAPSDSTLSAAKRALLERRLAQRSGGDRIGARPADADVQLSSAQERLWFMEQLAPGTAAYAVPVAVRLTGPLDTDRLAAALNALADRHEVLRMRVPVGDGGQPAPVIDEAVTVPLRIVEADTDGALDLIRDDLEEPFDLAGGPLVRALLIRLGEREHVLALTSHHVVSDGWSTDIVVGELLALYRGDELPALPLQYADFAHWQRDRVASDAYRTDIAFWRDRLAGVAPLELPTDKPRPAVQSFEGAAFGFHLDAELTAALTELGRANGATLYMTLLSAYQVLLGIYARQDDFAIGSPVAGRGRTELEGLVGMFVNVLALPSSLAGANTFTELLTATRRSVLDAMSHQELPFDQLVNDLAVKRDVSRSPLFQVTFAMQNYARGRHTDAEGDLAVSWYPVQLPATRFDLELYVTEADAGLKCLFTYSTALFGEPTVSRLAQHFETLLRAVVARPEGPLAELSLLGEAELATIMGWGAETGDFPVSTTLPQLFEARAAETPDAIALVFGDAEVTYADLNARANRLAHHLRGRGVGPDTLVAISVERSLDTIVAILGVLKAGGAYVPLDPANPAERLDFILGDTGAEINLTHEVLREVSAAGGPEHNPEPLAGPANLAYVIYTSGSTGLPKGVLIEHRQVVRLLDSCDEVFDFTAADTWIMLHSYAFDFSVWEIWGALAKGGKLVIVPADVVRDHEQLFDVLRDTKVTVLNQTPAAFRALRATLAATDRSFADTDVRTIVFGGAELHVRELRQWFTQYGDAKPALVNMYGITETTVHVTAHRMRRADLRRGVSSPIGRQLGDLRAYVLDQHGNPVPAGVPGELYVGGAGLARGYLNRPELNAERFPRDPFHSDPDARMYRTGDQVRWLPEGDLEYLGRVDQQVKVRGYRIEPGEIVAALEKHPQVRAAAVLARDDGNGDRSLVGYIVANGVKPSTAELREHLRATLPEYMVPAAFVALEALPITANGKLDHRALPEPDWSGGAAETAFVAPRTDAERLVAGVWAELLTVEQIGIDDDFFDLGGHSLLATQMVSRLRKATGPGSGVVTVMDIFRSRTVRELAALIDNGPTDVDQPRKLLFELTRGLAPEARTRSYVCVPYGGGSAVVYQPLADALPKGQALFAVATHGHDVGRIEDTMSLDEMATACVAEILAEVPGPLVLYGHCGVGATLTVEIARRLEAAGRELEAVYIAAIFPFARPRGILGGLSRFAQAERLRSNRTYTNRLKSQGVDLEDFDSEQIDRIVRNMRHDSRSAEDYFDGLLHEGTAKLHAPIISVIGDQDPATDFFQERYREWEFLSDTTALVVLAEGGHYFARYRAEELAEIVSRTDLAVEAGITEPLTQGARGEAATWWLHGVHRAGEEPPAAASKEVKPSMGRFLSVIGGQFVSVIGSSLTGWAVPIWIYTTTGSMMRFALFVVVAMVPGLLVAPLAGALVDRFDRRKVMLAANIGAGTTQVALGALLWTDNLQIWHIYVLLIGLSISQTFQRLGYAAAIAQLVPKHYLGHAMGAVQLVNGLAVICVPLFAVGIMAAIGLDGIVVIDIITFVVMLGVLLIVRFPNTMPWRPKEPLLTEIANGFRFAGGNKGFRAMLTFFVAFNIFLAGPMIMSTPLVLSFGDLTDASRIAFVEGLGVVLAGFAVLLWGGPPRRRMRGVLIAALCMGFAVAVVGSAPSLIVIGIGVFAMSVGLTFVNGIYGTIVQVKVPQRYHGRVFAVNQMISWSTLPLGFAVIAPLGTAVFEPMLMPGGALADTVGVVLGTGPGRGMGFLYLILGAAMVVLVLVAMRTRALSRFDTDVPDALPDDVVGVQVLAERAAASTAPAVEERPLAGARR